MVGKATLGSNYLVSSVCKAGQHKIYHVASFNGRHLRFRTSRRQRAVAKRVRKRRSKRRLSKCRSMRRRSAAE